MRRSDRESPLPRGRTGRLELALTVLCSLKCGVALLRGFQRLVFGAFECLLRVLQPFSCFFNLFVGLAGLARQPRRLELVAAEPLFRVADR
jgi:hypothetical protein